MQNFMKTIMSAFKKWTEKKIEEKINNVPTTAPDWGQNDENSVDYIKNRTHWEEIESQQITENITINFANCGNVDWGQSKSGYLYEYINATFDVNKTYKIIFDGTSYICNAFMDKSYNNIVVGNGAFVADINEDNGLPFAIGNYYNGDNSAYVIVSDKDTHEITILECTIIIHKLDSKYLDLIESLNKENPSGFGSLSINRSENSVIGSCSSAVGVGVIANNKAQSVIGEYNAFDNSYYVDTITEASDTTKFNYDLAFYSGRKITFDKNTGLYTIVDGVRYEPTFSGRIQYNGFYFMPDNNIGNVIYEVQGAQTTVMVDNITKTVSKANSKLKKHKAIFTNELRGTYAHIVGNGTSDEARSNAHTLDWNGNAWYQGNIYVGSTSGTNKDEGSKKLATEEYVSDAITDSKTEILDINFITVEDIDEICNLTQ